MNRLAALRLHAEYQNGVEVGASEPTFPETVKPLTGGIDDVYAAYEIIITTR